MDTENAGLFDSPSGDLTEDADGMPLEQRLDALADVAKEAAQSVAKLRSALNQITENAQAGSIGSARSRIERLPAIEQELSALCRRIAEHSSVLLGSALSPSDYMKELEPHLATRGVKVSKGPEPYWLAYPCWFRIEHDSTGSLQVVLNGERLDSVRPSAVASKIEEAANEKFDAKQFKQLLVSVRDLMRRAGARGSVLTLDDIFGVLTIGPGRRSPRGGEFSRAAFYYSVHRLAEASDVDSSLGVSFPAANRTDTIFFTKDGESRKYITVEFTGAS